MQVGYILLRVIRHFMPEKLTRFLLRRGIIIKPGLETRDPAQAAARYAADLKAVGSSIEGKSILVFGYGGRFDIAVELLKLGAAHITLTDLYAPPDDHRNDHLAKDNPDYLDNSTGQTTPREKYISLWHGDIREIVTDSERSKFDVVVSTSVYEHLDDVDGVTAALAQTLKPDGYFIAYIDLRDHYFKLPFEMLSYSAEVWKSWLNPTSNLNRLRLPQYQLQIGRYFVRTEWSILEKDIPAFFNAKARILPQFLSGEDEVDAVTLVKVIAQKTRPSS